MPLFPVEWMAFAITTAVAIIAAMFVVFHRNPVINAVALVVNLACIALFFLLLGAPFLAALQIIIYAGAIMVLFLFVIMLLDLRAELYREAAGRFQIAMAFLGGAGLLGLLGTALHRSRRTFGIPEVPVDGFGAPERVATDLFTEYLVPFELASVLLLVAMVGALMLMQCHAEENAGRSKEGS
jgi:NADH-quinone oxidoreductase subunit J